LTRFFFAVVLQAHHCDDERQGDECGECGDGIGGRSCGSDECCSSGCDDVEGRAGEWCIGGSGEGYC
jgi:hypothetical protein